MLRPEERDPAGVGQGHVVIGRAHEGIAHGLAAIRPVRRQAWRCQARRSRSPPGGPPVSAPWRGCAGCALPGESCSHRLSSRRVSDQAAPSRSPFRRSPAPIIRTSRRGSRKLLISRRSANDHEQVDAIARRDQAPRHLEGDQSAVAIPAEQVGAAGLHFEQALQVALGHRLDAPGDLGAVDARGRHEVHGRGHGRGGPGAECNRDRHSSNRRAGNRTAGAPPRSGAGPAAHSGRGSPNPGPRGSAPPPWRPRRAPRSETFRPRVWPIFSIIRTARSESPPRSRKGSRMPTGETSSSSSQMPAMVSCSALVGATNAAAPAGRSEGGTGNAGAIDLAVGIERQ